MSPESISSPAFVPLAYRPVTGPLVSAFDLCAPPSHRDETLPEIADRAAALVAAVAECDREDVAGWIRSETGVHVVMPVPSDLAAFLATLPTPRPTDCQIDIVGTHGGRYPRGHGRNPNLDGICTALYLDGHIWRGRVSVRVAVEAAEAAGCRFNDTPAPAP